MRTQTRKNNDLMLKIVDEYLSQGGTEPIDLDELARFAMSKGLWNRHTSKLIQMCKRDFSRAFREQYHRDPQGREVRTFHAVRTKSGDTQKTFWANIVTAPEEHMEVAFNQRRNQIVGECKQLNRDVSSFNDNNTNNAKYQLSLNFTEDIAELEQPIEYTPNQPR